MYPELNKTQSEPETSWNRKPETSWIRKTNFPDLEKMDEFSRPITLYLFGVRSCALYKN
jgi:hypothetical protein